MRALVPWLVIGTAACGRIGFGAVPIPGGDGDALGSSCPADALVCDDFESGVLAAAWTDTALAAGATLVIDGSAAHAGTRGLDATVPAESIGGGEAAPYVLFPAQTTGVLAARAWVRSPATLQNFDGVIDLSSSPTAPVAYAQASCSDVSDWTAEDAGSASGLHEHPSAVACPPPNTWVCVELDYTFGSPSEIQVFVDGNIAIDNVAVDPTPQFDTAAIGATRAQMTGEHVLVDDVVIATSHIGC